MTEQYEISLPSFPRGIHLVTNEIERHLKNLPQKGLLNIFIKHTSAGLAINENADPTVRTDLEKYLDRYIPENEPYYRHTMEGPDDMPAHIKSVFTGNSVIVPISGGRLNLGTWQGIYLCEFRNHGGSRKLVLTVIS
ncbi:MAG: secondary thiamine-phosphate synthase enzyme YjbQ [Bacteroidales bacterium]